MLSRLLFGLKPAKEPRRHVIPPRGTFDIVGERCVGFVGNDSGKREQFDVLLKRKGYVIASEVVSSSGRDNRARFSIDFSGIATGGDFAREHVLVTAVDAFGAVGRLGLDSTTQIDLIQRYMGKPHEVLLDLTFASGGNARPKLGIGWSNPEPTFCWTEGERSEVTLDFPPSPGTHELTLFCSPYLSEPIVTDQQCSVYLDDELVGFFTKNKKTLFVERIKLPAPLLEQGGPKMLRLLHPDAKRPKEISDSRDSRMLAFAYKKILLTRPIDT